MREESDETESNFGRMECHSIVSGHTRVKGEGLLLVLTQYVIVNRVLWEMSAYVACDERRTVIRLVHFQQY